MSTIWPASVDGELSPDGTIRLGILGGAVHTGAGLFETVLYRDRGPELWEQHLERLGESARWLGWDPPGNEIWEEDLRILETAGFRSPCALRLLLLRDGEHTRRCLATGSLPSEEAGPATLALARSVIADEGPRDLAFLKATSYLKSLTSLALGRSMGVSEVLFCAGSQVLEGTRSSVFAVQAGTLNTPPTNGEILPGVMRAEALRVAELEGIPTEERGFTVEELADADEIFLTSSLMEVRPVAHFQGRKFPAPGAITRRISASLGRR